MKLEEQIYQEYLSQIKEHMEENKKGAFAVKDYVERSPLFWNGQADKTLQIPKVYQEETIRKFRDIVRMAHGIFRKVILEYRTHEDYRELFPFPKKLQQLMLLPPQYKGVLPIARFDIFYHEDTGEFYFCEINTDGTAAMLRDLELGRALIANPAHQEVIRKFRLEQFELFDSWVHEFLKLYGTYHKKKEHPSVAIVDFLENATLRDFEEFARRFQKAGMDCEICDIRSLSYKDGVLYSGTGHQIDAVYRRSVTRDILEHWDEASDFLEAVRDDAVFVAGAFDTQIIHSKWLFYALHQERTARFLTKEERLFIKKHIPITLGFDSENIQLEQVREKKDDYIIKPVDSYSSKGVYAAGREYSRGEWEKITEKLYGKGYICQRYCPQFLTENIDFAWGDGKWHPYMNMPGLYVYNGELAGVLCRMAEGEHIIVAHENERTVPVFVVKER